MKNDQTIYALKSNKNLLIIKTSSLNERLNNINKLKGVFSYGI